MPDRCQLALTQPFGAAARVRTVLQGYDAAAAAWAAMLEHRIINSSTSLVTAAVRAVLDGRSLVRLARSAGSPSARPHTAIDSALL